MFFPSPDSWKLRHFHTAWHGLNLRDFYDLMKENISAVLLQCTKKTKKLKPDVNELKLKLLLLDMQELPRNCCFGK